MVVSELQHRGQIKHKTTHWFHIHVFLLVSTNLRVGTQKKKWKILEDDEPMWRSLHEVAKVGDKQIYKLETSRSIS